MIFQFRSPRPSSAFRGDNPSVVVCRPWIMENHGEGETRSLVSPVRIFPAIRGRTRKRDFDWPRSPVGIKRAIFDTRRPVFDRRLKKSKLSNWDVFFSFSLKFVREEISSSILSRINFKSKRFLFFLDIFVIFVVSLTFIAKVRTKIQVSNHEHLGDDQDEPKVASRIILAERILVVYGRLEFEFCSIVTRSRVRRSLSYVYTSKSYSGALANVYMRSPEKIGYLFPQEDTSWIKYERFVGGLVRGR